LLLAGAGAGAVLSPLVGAGAVLLPPAGAVEGVRGGEDGRTKGTFDLLRDAREDARVRNRRPLQADERDRHHRHGHRAEGANREPAATPRRCAGRPGRTAPSPARPGRSRPLPGRVVLPPPGRSGTRSPRCTTWRRQAPAAQPNRSHVRSPSRGTADEGVRPGPPPTRHAVPAHANTTRGEDAERRASRSAPHSAADRASADDPASVVGDRASAGVPPLPPVEWQHTIRPETRLASEVEYIKTAGAKCISPSDPDPGCLRQKRSPHTVHLNAPERFR
jgi:hypothetical protein